MAAPQNAPLPPFFTLVNGYTVRITAQNPTTGATVTGVVASNVSLAVDQKSAGGTGAVPPNPLLVPFTV